MLGSNSKSSFLVVQMTGRFFFLQNNGVKVAGGTTGWLRQLRGISSQFLVPTASNTIFHKYLRALDSMAEKPINKGPKPHVKASVDGIRHLTIHPLNTVGLVQ